ncbi:MAG: HNH endonuclease [Ktedonobacteraceae bacterium]|jgi:hypothetical protein
MVASEWFKREERDAQAWENIRRQVLKRDNATCVYCGFRANKFMAVNHIGAEDNHDLENLETTCKPCHAVLHIGINAMKGYLTVISSSVNQVDIVNMTRRLVWQNTPWKRIEEIILERFLTPGGTIYDQQESVRWANKILASIPKDEHRGYLPDGLAVVFHEEGPWKQFSEAVHKWGKS